MKALFKNILIGVVTTLIASIIIFSIMFYVDYIVTINKQNTINENTIKNNEQHNRLYRIVISSINNNNGKIETRFNNFEDNNNNEHEKIVKCLNNLTYVITSSNNEIKNKLDNLNASSNYLNIVSINDQDTLNTTH